jgi:hypothetical protein
VESKVLDASFLSVTVCFGAELSVQTHLDASFLSATVCFGDELSVKTQFGDTSSAAAFQRFKLSASTCMSRFTDFQIYDDHHHA